jgi:F0F1-type ATP synthase assembly protein I
MADPDRRSTQGTSGGEALGYALTLVASTLFFLWVGSAVDRWLSTGPLLSAVGALIGAGAGIYYMVRRLS